MRSKEEADDYRYFPEPDLVPLDITQDWINQLKTEVPELPLQKKERFITEYKIPEYDAGVLVADLQIANFFENTVKHLKNAKSVSNFIMGEVLRYLGEEKTSIEATKLTPENLADLLLLVENGTINLKVAKQIFPDVIKLGTSPEDIVKKQGLGQVSDEGDLQKIVLEVINSNPTELEKYLAGKDKLFGFFVGQIMRATRGKGNPKVVNQLLKDELNKLKK